MSHPDSSESELVAACCYQMITVDPWLHVAVIQLQILGGSRTAPRVNWWQHVGAQVARLFLVSDILYNSTAPVRNASRYRARLENALPDVFDSLQETYRTADGRMAQVRPLNHLK
jgi:hypothetical protein